MTTTPDREEALRVIRNGIRADSCQHSNDGILKDVANEALDALAADLEAAEQKVEKLSALIIEQEKQHREERR